MLNNVCWKAELPKYTIKQTGIILIVVVTFKNENFLPSKEIKLHSLHIQEAIVKIKKIRKVLFYVELQNKVLHIFWSFFRYYKIILPIRGV